MVSIAMRALRIAAALGDLFLSSAGPSELPAMQMRFMSESRRLENRRMKVELGLTLKYPTVVNGLASC
jgi:hypothetical protein